MSPIERVVLPKAALGGDFRPQSLQPFGRIPNGTDDGWWYDRLSAQFKRGLRHDG